MNKASPLTPTERMTTSEEYVQAQRRYTNKRLLELAHCTDADRSDELVRELQSLGQLVGVSRKAQS